MTLHSHHWEQTLQLRADEAESIHDSPNDDLEYDAASLRRAFSVCERITAVNSRSFYLASSLLPRKKRAAARALYAFCRVTDDIVDESTGDADADLQQWRNKVTQGTFSAEDSVALAWTYTRRKYNIPSRYMIQLIEGVARDLHQDRYDTFDDLASYSYSVASTVGLMSMHIIGFTSREATSYAIKLGVALQLTNILRDVGQDWKMGRIYLPQEDLHKYGIDNRYFNDAIIDDKWRRFMRFQIARARNLYDEAWAGISLLNRDGRFAIATAADLYRAILGDIEANDFDVFNRRAHLSGSAKLRRLPSIWMRTMRS